MERRALLASLLAPVFAERAAGAAAPVPVPARPTGAPTRAGGGALPAGPTIAAADGVEPLAFPADFGAHPDVRTEWWYATGAIEEADRLWGFQITFFRVTTEVAPDHPSRFAASQLLFAHAALTDIAAGRLRHDQRIARSGFGIAEAATGDTRVGVRGWSLERTGAFDAGRYHAQLPPAAAGFGFDLDLRTTQPILLQGIAGLSRKGPRPESSSRYYSQPQLAVDGTLMLDGRSHAVRGRAWIDHEWSDAFLDAEAVGWDWIGMNLTDGSALTAFRLRRRDGSALWAGGSFRAPQGEARNFRADEVRFAPGRLWNSAASKATYPVEWSVETPVGRYAVRALLDNQELDSRASTGSVYWEGLSDLLDAGGARLGRGYLEMTGYAGRLAL